MPKFKEGQRVWLREIKEGEDYDPCPRQRATINSIDHMRWGISIIAKVIQEDRDGGPYDDGLREFAEDQDLIEPGTTWEIEPGMAPETISDFEMYKLSKMTLQ